MDSRVKIMKALQRVNVDRWRRFRMADFFFYLQIGVFYSRLKLQLDHLK